ncbi:hypothetical protein ACXZ9C_10835 [Streptococcus agalactiae]
MSWWSVSRSRWSSSSSVVSISSIICWSGGVSRGVVRSSWSSIVVVGCVVRW